MNTKTKRLRDGRGWAYAGVVLGIVLSIAANLASRFIAPDDAPADWKPGAGMIIAAVVWPVLLYIALELFARFPWPAAWRYRLIRFGPLVFVAFVAGSVSYQHMRHLLLAYGEDKWTATLGPLAVDGLMIMSAGALIASAAAARQVIAVELVAERQTEPVTAPTVKLEPVAPALKLHVVPAARPPQPITARTVPALATNGHKQIIAPTDAQPIKRRPPLTDAERVAAVNAYKQQRAAEPGLKRGDVIAAIAREYGMSDRTLERAVAKSNEQTGQTT